MDVRDNHMKSRVKISIIEDSGIHSEWLRVELLGDRRLEVVSVDSLGRRGIESIKSHQPDLALLDFQLVDMTGLEVAKRIKAHDENIKIFIITALSEASIIDHILNDKNIDAVAIKGSPYFEDNLLSAINHVVDGGVYLDPSLLKKLRESNKSKGLSSLTRREFEIFIQANSGKVDTEIAEDLCVELAYVKNLKSKISKKVKGDDLNSVLSKLIENANVSQVS